MGEIREPKKKTSIEKKRQIIEKGFLLMCEEGYYNVTCVDIAKKAGVSTGIIYQYFKDKRDIFLEGVRDYSNKIMFPMLDVASSKKIEFSNLREIIGKMIDHFIRAHTMSKKAHEQLMAMSYLDKDVATIFLENEMLMTKKVSAFLLEDNIEIENMKEKIHIIMGLMDQLCHEIVYHKHKELNYTVYKEQVIDSILALLQ